MDLEALDINDIAPIMGQLQINGIHQEKIIRVLRQRVAELEARLDGADLDINRTNGAADTTAIPLET